jgi:hypothetical protein
MYQELLVRGTLAADDGDFLVFEVNTGPPDFAPCQAEGHDELVRKPGVTVVE